MKRIIGIKFSHYGQIYFFYCEDPFVGRGDRVLAETGQGLGIATVMNIVDRLPEDLPPDGVRDVLRKVTDEDQIVAEENDTLTYSAHKFCESRIRERQLDMKLVDVEVLFDRSKLVFYFTAPTRIDFRELVKDLVREYHTRIELRQIGVRDKARMVGGLGICGRPFCCASFLDDFQPVSIKMAKTQNLSLNPTKISGTCGRLMCCLKYEQDAYEDLIRNSPRMDSFVDTPEGRGTVVEVGLLRQRVKVRMEDNPETISVFSNEDIAVLRSGKARKNDPPIPADLAPISGSGKRVRREQTEEKPLLEPIRFRYSTEKIVDDPEEEKPETAESPEPKASRSRNRRRKPRPQVQDAAPEQAKPAPQEAAAKPEASGDRPRRRPNHRRRKPRPAGDGQ